MLLWLMKFHFGSLMPLGLDYRFHELVFSLHLGLLHCRLLEWLAQSLQQHRQLRMNMLLLRLNPLEYLLLLWIQLFWHQQLAWHQLSSRFLKQFSVQAFFGLFIQLFSQLFMKFELQLNLVFQNLFRDLQQGISLNHLKICWLL